MRRRLRTAFTTTVNDDPTLWDKTKRWDTDVKLPKAFVEKGLAFKDSKLFGTKLEDLTHEELLAAAGIGWHNYHTLQKQIADEQKFIDSQVKQLDKANEQIDKMFKDIDEGFPRYRKVNGSGSYH